MPQTLKTATLVFLGGALGSGFRFLLGLQLDTFWYLFAANLLGALLLGFVSGRAWAHWVQPFFGTGVAGGFTTMSGVSLLINAHLVPNPITTCLEIVTMVAAGLAAYSLGKFIARGVR